MYKKMYTKLFNAVTDAVEMLERGDDKVAKLWLEMAQLQTEEMYIEKTSKKAPFWSCLSPYRKRRQSGGDDQAKR